MSESEESGREMERSIELELTAVESVAPQALRSDCSVDRMRVLTRLMTVLENLWRMGFARLDGQVSEYVPDRGWCRRCFYALLQLRRTLENCRVQLHPELSVTVFCSETGLTEDVCYFLGWCMCTWLCRGSQWAVGNAAADRTMDEDTTSLWENGVATYSQQVKGYLWSGCGVKTLTPVQLDCAFATLFTHARHLDWQHPLFPPLTMALQMRAAELLFRRSYLLGDGQEESAEDSLQWCERRVLWSCATARLKLSQLSTVNWKTHVIHRLSAILDDDGFHRGTEVTATQFRQYLELTVQSWVGPRLRESLAKANNRRLLRPDEIGRNAAFEGNNKFCRARGTMDAMENAMHNLEVKQLMCCPEDELLLACLGLRELLMLRIMHNALETSTSCDLMGRHVMLQTLRDNRKSQGGTEVNLFVHKVMELPGGFVVTPHQSHYPESPTTLEEALLLWYNTHFERSDPLGMASTMVEYITEE